MCTPEGSNNPGWICCKCVGRNNHARKTCGCCSFPRDHGGHALADTERDLTIAHDEMFNGNMSLAEWIDVYVPLIQLVGRHTSLVEEFERRRVDIEDEFAFRRFPADALDQIRAALGLSKEHAVASHLGDTTP